MEKRLSFKKLDAFVSGMSSGNPAGCVYLGRDDRLTEEEMQRIARELKGFVNEVAFLTKDAIIRLEYFSSECRVDFCGHATIAAIYDLVANDPMLLACDSVKIRVGDEELDVINRVTSHKAVFITSPKPRYEKRSFDSEKLLKALNINLNALRNDLTIESINAGLSTVIVPLDALKPVLGAAPDFNGLKSWCLNNDQDIVIIFSEEVSEKGNRVRSRVFAPKFGYLEDPATGSGNSALGCYLLKYGMWDGSPVTIEQNSSFTVPNHVLLMTTVSPEGKRVAFGGNGIVRIEGEYIINGG